MALLSQVQQYLPAEVARLGLQISDDLLHLTESQEGRFNAWALDYAEFGRPLAASETPPLGIYGAGLLRSAETGEFVPGLVVMPELLGGAHPKDIEGGLREPGLTYLQRGALFDLTPPLPQIPQLVELLSTAEILVVQPIEEQFKRVDSAGGDPGSVGVPIWFTDDRPGFLTAGHVAPVTGEHVLVDRKRVGQVEFSDHRRNYRHPAEATDVASVALNHSLTGWKEIAGLGPALELGRVKSYSRSNTGHPDSQLIGIHDRIALDGNAAWRDVHLVNPTVSIGGDSGSAVVNEASEVIGQVVGGIPGALSVVQDVRLLLQETHTRLREV